MTGQMGPRSISGETDPRPTAHDAGSNLEARRPTSQCRCWQRRIVLNRDSTCRSCHLWELGHPTLLRSLYHCGPSSRCMCPHTLRFYERKGPLPEPPRRMSGYREYPKASLRSVERNRTVGGFSIILTHQNTDTTSIAGKVSQL